MRITSHMSHGQTLYMGDCIGGLYRVLIKGLLGFISGMLTMAHMEAVRKELH